MVRDIKERNFPSYATLHQATVSLADMGERTITAQVRIDGGIAPDFSYDWEVEFRGERYIQPLRKPHAWKENTSLDSVIELTFQHWAERELKRWYFFTMQPVDSGTAVADQYNASVSLNLKNFCTLFNQVLDYYFEGRIVLVCDVADSAEEPTAVEINHSYLWDVLTKMYEVYDVRWRIERDAEHDRYVIRIGYPTEEVGHIFGYGFERGLLKVERQVQSDEIRNMLIGRGGEKNLPYRYHKDVDPSNTSFPADPDWIPELGNIYFDRLRGATFRSYVRGWRARHYGGASSESEQYAPWAWLKGYTDEKFRPVEYVKDEESIMKYGPLMGGLDDNDDIYPTIQGVIVDPYGRIDQAVDVEQVTENQRTEEADTDGKEEPLAAFGSEDVSFAAGERKTVTLYSGAFTVDDGLFGNFDEGVKNISVTGVKEIYVSPIVRKLAGIEGPIYEELEGEGYSMVIEKAVMTAENLDTGEEISAVGMPSGRYRVKITLSVYNTYRESARIRIDCPSPRLVSGTGARRVTGVFDIWIKNVWISERLDGESDDDYARRVWTPILGDRWGSEAKVVFASGMLSTSEDYEFTIIKGGVHFDDSKELGGVRSHWRLTCALCDADLDSTGEYVPSVMRQGKAGDYLFFIGIDMPFYYVDWAERRLDDWKKEALETLADIRPSWVVTVDKVRVGQLYGEEKETLLDALVQGRAITLADERFIEGSHQETLFIQSVTLTYNEPTSEDAALTPDIEVVLGTEYAVSANPISELQSDVEVIRRSLALNGDSGSRFTAALADRRYVRKDRDDATPFVLTAREHRSKQASQVGDFAEGWFGKGARVWRNAQGKTVGELDILRVRDSLETMKLRFNMVDVVSGEQWQTFAYGTVDTVTAESAFGGWCTIDLVDGEYITFKPGDIVRGIFHNVMPDGSEPNNGSADTDPCGFPQVPGYTTVYLTPTELVDAEGNALPPITDEAGNVMTDAEGNPLLDIANAKGFRYTLRQGTAYHPVHGMNLAAYGSFSDLTRQATTFATTTRLTMLEGVNTWRIEPSRHYAYVRGDLDGLEIGGLRLEGHGVMMGHAYLYGPTIKFTREQLDELEGADAYSVHLTSEAGVVTLGADGQPQALVARHLVADGESYVTADNGEPHLVTASAAILTTAIQVHRAGDALMWAESIPAVGSYTAAIAAHGCDAVIERGVVRVTKITDYTSTPYIDIVVNCEGEVIITRRYTIAVIPSADWTTYVFAPEIDGNAPKAPTSRGPQPWVEDKATIWRDAPAPYDAQGRLIYPIWYMSRAVIDGATATVKGGWSVPVRCTGEDGGNTDFMYAVSDSIDAVPAYAADRRNPNEGLASPLWHDTPQPMPQGGALWMIVADIMADGTTNAYDDGVNDPKRGTLAGAWSYPVRISGEHGRDVITADLDNEADILMLDAVGASWGEPITATAHLINGATHLNPESYGAEVYSVDADGNRVGYDNLAYELTPADDCGVKLTIKGLTAPDARCPRALCVEVWLEADGITRSVVLSLTCLTANWKYQLAPQPAQLVVDAQGNITTDLAIALTLEDARGKRLITEATDAKAPGELYAEGLIAAERRVSVAVAAVKTDGSTGQWQDIDALGAVNAAAIAGADLSDTAAIRFSLRYLYDHDGLTATTDDQTWCTDSEDVPLVRDGKDGERGAGALTADLDNEYDTILMTDEGVYALPDDYLPTTHIRLFEGQTQLALGTLSLVSVNGVEASATSSGGLKRYAGDGYELRLYARDTLAPSNDMRGTLKIASVGADLPDRLELRFAVTAAEDATKIGYAEWTLVRENGACIYRLIPEASQIHVDGKGSITDPDSARDGWLRCDVQRIDRDGATMLSALPDGFGLFVDEYEPQGNQGGEVDYARGVSLTGIAEYGVTAYEFTLYNADGRLLDRESVPVVRDGKAGDKGERGIPGLRVRMWKELRNGQVYRNDEGSADADATGYVDFLALRCDAVDSGWAVYRVRKDGTYTSRSDIPATTILSTTELDALRAFIGNDADNWETVDENLNTGFFNFLVANHALIDILSSTQLLIRNDANNIVGGLQGAVGDMPIFWAGAEQPGNAKVKIYSDGHAEIQGSFLAGIPDGSHVYINPDDGDITIYDASGAPRTILTGKSVTIDSLNAEGDIPKIQIYSGSRELTSSNADWLELTSVFVDSNTATGTADFTIDTEGLIELAGVRSSVADTSGVELTNVPTASFSLRVRDNDGKTVWAANVIEARNTDTKPIFVSPDRGSYRGSFVVEQGKTYGLEYRLYMVSSAANSAVNVRWQGSSDTDILRSTFGANGFVLARSETENYAVIEEDTYDEWGNAEGKKLSQIRNGLRQPFTVYAARITFSDGDYEIDEMVGKASSFGMMGTSGLSFYLPQQYAEARLIINATSQSHGAYGCTHRVGNYFQAKLMSGSSYVSSGTLYIEIKTI